MSRTYKLIRYKKGKPVYSRHLNNEATYHWYRKENPIQRKKLYRAYRRRCKTYFQKFGDYIPFVNTNGWETW